MVFNAKEFTINLTITPFVSEAFVAIVGAILLPFSENRIAMPLILAAFRFFPVVGISQTPSLITSKAFVFVFVILPQGMFAILSKAAFVAIVAVEMSFKG